MTAASEIDTGVVGDDEVFRVERTVRTVECGQFLAGGGAAHHERPGDAGRVEGVHGLAEFEHQIVGDVDGERDGPHAGESESPPHPVGAGRGRVDSGDEAGDEPVAAGGVDDGDRVRRLRGGGRGRHRARVAQRQAERVGQLAGDAAHAEAVAPVGGDVEFDDDLVESDDGPRVVARLRRSPTGRAR